MGDSQQDGELSPLSAAKPKVNPTKRKSKAILDRIGAFEKGAAANVANQSTSMRALLSPPTAAKPKVRNSYGAPRGLAGDLYGGEKKSPKTRPRQWASSAHNRLPDIASSPFQVKQRYELEKKLILEARRGSVMDIKLKFDDQEIANVKWREAHNFQSKSERKARFRKKQKTSDDREHRSVITKQTVKTEDCWKEVQAESIQIDIKTYQAPTNLVNPTPLQHELIHKAMKQSLLLQDHTNTFLTNEHLLKAFESVQVSENETLQGTEDGNYFYVVESGKLDFKVDGKTVRSAIKGDTFGELDLLYNQAKVQTIVADLDAPEETKVIRLDQKAFRGIVQYQTKQEEEEKRALLKKIPFMRDLLWAMDGTEIFRDTTNRLCMFMKPKFFNKGDYLVEHPEAATSMLYMVQSGSIELTSTKNDKFVLGPEAYIGKKAIMGVAGKGEPSVASIKGHGYGKIYSIDKANVDKVLGKNYFSRKASRRQDSKKLGGFECIKKVNLDTHTMEHMAKQIEDKPFEGGEQVLEEGVETDPCLFFVREGAVILSSKDGKFKQRIPTGGYFGVEQLLRPEGADASPAPTDVLIPAQWTVTVEGDDPCLCGVLPLNKIQSHLDSQAEEKLAEEETKDKFELKKEAFDPSYRTSKTRDNKSWRKTTREEGETGNKHVKNALSSALGEGGEDHFLQKKTQKLQITVEEQEVAQGGKEEPKEGGGSVLANAIIKERERRRKAVEGNVKFDDLEMLEVLGDGQFGEVWLVETTLDGEKQKFALKRQEKKEQNMKEIRRELQVTQELTTSHPMIVELVHTFESEDSIDMLMGLITGGELWDVVHREDDDGNWTSGIPESQAKFYALLIADTLAFMHAHNYVYRDLKPENVMIDGDGYPVIVDFGFAKVCEDMTFTFCGTPNYVSPEIIRNTGHNASADYWALGVVIFEMIAGEHPFYVDGMDNMMVFESICKEPHYPLSKVKSDVSDEAVELVDALLEKEVADRLGMLSGKSKDIMDHKWFDGLDLRALRSKKVKAPWIPSRHD